MCVYCNLHHIILWCSFKVWWNFCLDLLSSKFWLVGEWSIEWDANKILIFRFVSLHLVISAAVLIKCGFQQRELMRLPSLKFRASIRNMSSKLVWIWSSKNYSSKFFKARTSSNFVTDILIRYIHTTQKKDKP
jgi:hypothetical protein